MEFKVGQIVCMNNSAVRSYGTDIVDRFRGKIIDVYENKVELRYNLKKSITEFNYKVFISSEYLKPFYMEVKPLEEWL